MFKTYLVPSTENVAEAMAEAGRLYHDSAGAIKNKPEAERADAQEQLGPPFVYVWVAFLRSLAATKEFGAEHVAVLEQRVEERTSAVGIARAVLQSEAVQESRGQGRVDAHCVLPGPDHNPPRGSTGGSIAAAERSEEIRPRAKRPPRTRSGEAPDADAREIERLARRVEQHSQRMAELLRRGVLEPSLANAFLMTKGGNGSHRPNPRPKLGRVAGRRRVKELRLPLTCHRHVSRQKGRPWCSRGAKRWNPLMLVRGCEFRAGVDRERLKRWPRSQHKLDALSSAGHCLMAPAQG